MSNNPFIKVKEIEQIARKAMEEKVQLKTITNVMSTEGALKDVKSIELNALQRLVIYNQLSLRKEDIEGIVKYLELHGEHKKSNIYKETLDAIEDAMAKMV
jgi:hypothetical protein